MTIPSRAVRSLTALLAILLVAAPAAHAEETPPPVLVSPLPSTSPLPPPTTLKPNDPWIYRGTDIPHDKGWLFGELPNGLRYAVRTNYVPPGQASIRIRIDAGSLNEKDDERGYAHLIEHLTFRESKYLANGQAIPTWQRLGARLGADTNAITSPTDTVYKLDLPDASFPKLDESIKLLSGMIREPALSEANVAAEVPIVLAEKREGGGAGRRFSDAMSELFYKDQLLASRMPGGTDDALLAATSAKLKSFHQSWYRPENTVIVIAGDGDAQTFAALIEHYFSDWKPAGRPVAAPDLGKPAAPAGADPANPVGETKVLVEPDLPLLVTVGIMRPWGKPIDNLEYNRGLNIDRVAMSIINRRLEERARAGGSFVTASVARDEAARSANATFISVTPLGNDWKGALKDVRSVLADALATPPSEAEIAREVAEIDVAYANYYEQRINQSGPSLADDLVGAVDIREAVASPETFLNVFRDMRARFTPEAVLEHSRKLFQGAVVRGLLLTPNEADRGAEDDLRQALLAPVEADGNSRITAADVSFDKLPKIGDAAEPVSRRQIGVLEIEQQDYANGVRALVWRTENEPGRVTVRVRFGAGYRAFSQDQGPYIALGRDALVASGVAELGASELDAIATGRKLGFEFSIDDGTFLLEAETRKEDLADQLYLFAAKLALPRWDKRPIERAKVLNQIGYNSLRSDPMSVISRDLDYILYNRDARFAVPTPEDMENTTPEGFRKVWEPLLKQGPVEVLVFGDIDPAATDIALARTFGALPKREPIPAEALARQVDFPAVPGAPVVLFHHGEKDQAAAVVAWKLGGGVEGLPVSRQLEVLGEIFGNRLLDEMRETAGASYTPFVSANWPTDIQSGGRMMAIGQVRPEVVPQFFAVADKIAADLAATGPTVDEIERVTEPYKQLLNRVVNGHLFWMNMVEGSTVDPTRLDKIDTLMSDYTETTPERMRELAATYLKPGGGFRVAVIPEGEELATAVTPIASRPSAGPVTGAGVTGEGSPSSR